MKRYFKIMSSVVIITCSLFACKQGIDSIAYVDPGPDNAAPSVTIDYPSNGVNIQVRQDIATINIQLTVTDDIEVKTIELLMDGTSIQTLNSFIDYRRVITSYTYKNVTNGAHVLTVKATDTSGKITSVNANFAKVPVYNPIYANLGEILYMPFDGDFNEKVSIQDATVVGSPSFTDSGKKGKAYKGNTSSYLTLPSSMVTSAVTTEMTAVMWVNLNATPDRAGILNISAPLKSDGSNDLSKGFQFFRESANGGQTYKLHTYFGSDVWADGGANATVLPANNGTWVHFAFTIGGGTGKVYMNGQKVAEATYSSTGNIDWTNCTVLSIMSGAPNFIGWSHKEDLSLLDELRIFNKALSASDISTIYNNEK